MDSTEVLSFLQRSRAKQTLSLQVDIVKSAFRRQLVAAHNQGVGLLGRKDPKTTARNANGDALRLLDVCEQDEDVTSNSPADAPRQSGGLAGELVPWREALAWLGETLRGAPAGPASDGAPLCSLVTVRVVKGLLGLFDHSGRHKAAPFSGPCRRCCGECS